MPKLTITEGDRTSTYEILDEVVLVGRREGASIRLSDPHASAEHCQIRFAPGFGFKLVDLESRNGTKVNGAFVNQHLLRDGDTIQVGQVRLTFSGAGAAPAPAAPAPAPAGVAPAPIAPAPVSPAPAPAPAFPARPASGGEREGGRPSRRMRRRGSDTPLIVGAVAAGSLVLVVLFLFLGSSWFGTSKNAEIYGRMQELIKEKRYAEAAALAETADPGGKPILLEKIRSEAERSRQLADSGGKLEDSGQALAEYQRIESWVQDHRDQVGAAIQRWQAFAAKWEGKSHWANQARLNAERLLGGPAPVAGPGGEKSPLEEDWRVTVATARHHEERNRFQDAIDTVQDFWSRHQLETGSSFDAWKRRVDAEVEKISDDAAARYNELESKARKLAAEGNVEAANAILRDIARDFGIPKYVQMATEERRALQRD